MKIHKDTKEFFSQNFILFSIIGLAISVSSLSIILGIIFVGIPFILVGAYEVGRRQRR